jgi:hypothetical protein
MQIAQNEQPIAVLGDAEVLCVQDLFSDVVAHLLESPQERLIAAPSPHLSNVLDDDPPRLELPSEPQDLERSFPACLGTLCTALSEGMVRALGRREQQIDIADPSMQLARNDLVQPFRDDVSFGKVVTVCAGRKMPSVHTCHDRGAGAFGACAAAAAAGEQIKGPDRHCSGLYQV